VAHRGRGRKRRNGRGHGLDRDQRRLHQGDSIADEARTSAIFVLDDEGDMEVILHAIRGLGGTVLKTNVDVERARLIQSTLAAPVAQGRKADGE
jgi:uncharacterized membrane protein